MKKLLLATTAVMMAGMAQAEEIKMGISLGFTGPLESMSPTMAAGAELAMKEVSDSGLLLDGDIEVEKDRVAAQHAFFKAAGAPCIVYGETARSVQGIKSAPLSTKPKLTEAETAAYGAMLGRSEEPLLCTEKDAVKLLPLLGPGDPEVRAVPLEVTLDPDFFARVRDALCHPTRRHGWHRK